jgi:hypothetical protein
MDVMIPRTHFDAKNRYLPASKLLIFSQLYFFAFFLHFS